MDMFVMALLIMGIIVFIDSRRKTSVRNFKSNRVPLQKVHPLGDIDLVIPIGTKWRHKDDYFPYLIVGERRFSLDNCDEIEWQDFILERKLFGIFRQRLFLTRECFEQTDIDGKPFWRKLT